MADALREKLQASIKSAMLARDKERLATLRLISAAIKQREVDERIVLDDAQILAVLTKMVKQRHESISHFQVANRQDLVEKEQFELSVIEEYLPPPLTELEVESMVKAAISSQNATSIQDMGKVIAQLKPELMGRADMGKVSQLVKMLLSN